MQLQSNYWHILINILMRKYLAQLTTTCILWHKNFDFILKSEINSNVMLHIDRKNLTNSFHRDIYNFTRQDEYFNGNQVFYDDMIKKFIAAIGSANCEGFLVFQDDIPLFAKSFRKASVYSPWRSLYSRFLFAYVKDSPDQDYFQDLFFQNQASILVIEAEAMSSPNFYLKTNKFVGSRKEHPEELILLSTFNALNRTFTPDIDLFSNEKLKDLQGREVIIAALDYRPFVAIDYERQPQYYDYAKDNAAHLIHIDGVETRISLTFCEIYNCTVQFDTSVKDDWGIVFKNFTGDGLMGMIIDGKVDMATGAVFAWDDAYINFDVSVFLGRSGITCLVPAPRRIVSWDLPLRPFRMTLWLLIMAILVVESICLLLARQFETFLESFHYEPEDWWSSQAFGFISAFKLFIGQGTDYIVQAYTLKVLLLACYMHDIIITSIYGGGLSSILTMPILEEAADSVERMFTHDLKWAGNTVLWVESIANEHDDPVIKRITGNFRFFTNEQIREMAKTENYGFSVERLMYGHFGNLDFVTPESIKHLKLMVDDIYYGFCVALAARLWAHLPKFNDLVLAWHSSGFDKVWEWRITAEYLNVHYQNQIIASRSFNFDLGPAKLDMSNFGGIILIWVLGMILGLAAFALELFFYKMHKKKLEGSKISPNNLRYN